LKTHLLESGEINFQKDDFANYQKLGTFPNFTIKFVYNANQGLKK